MNAELKKMLEKLTTSELEEVSSVVHELIEINKGTMDDESEDDGQPDDMKENSDFAKDDEIPFNEE